ncbi:component of SufBCD complex [Amaricoccus sp.]|uniref:component of SufBCD complex n=1 Tax=Amaricoccus sp. TaxID=1872485 RepID=UPI001B66DC59|nr:component of SufBCD complex [Amaricoccus sp.]MBP7001525.1 component of SufBCD complex [Amaricoccus sp.]
MLSVFRFESFFSVWYWALTVVVWALVCQRTLGVPHDMVVRAARLPEVAERVDLLARIGAERLAGIGDACGAWAAAAAGFALAGLATLAYAYRVEAAEAAFLLAFPLAAAGFGTLRLARQVRARRLSGEALRKRLSRRRAINQAIAMVAMVTAAVAALGHPPRFGF